MLQFTPQNIRTWSLLGPNGALGLAALELPSLNDKTVFLAADLRSYSGLNRFAAEYPKMFFNVGIAEQNMVGIAAGLAKEGFSPYVATYATFASMRVADQIKVCLGYMKQPVRVIGLGAGLSVGILGSTHIAVEDVAVMRSIPNMTVISPADCTETIKAVIACANIDKPVYLRLTGSMGNPPVYRGDYDFQIGRAITLREGEDIAIFASGASVYNAVKAAALLEQKGISARVVNMHTIKPLDVAAVDAARSAKLIVSVEEHSIIGGLGGAIAEELSSKPNAPKLLRLGVSDSYPKAGNYKWLTEKYALTSQLLSDKIFNVYSETI